MVTFLDCPTLCRCHTEHVINKARVILNTKSKTAFKDVTFNFPSNSISYSVQFERDYFDSLSEDDSMIAALLALKNFNIGNIWQKSRAYELFEDWKTHTVAFTLSIFEYTFYQFVYAHRVRRMKLSSSMLKKLLPQCISI